MQNLKVGEGESALVPSLQVQAGGGRPYALPPAAITLERNGGAENAIAALRHTITNMVGSQRETPKRTRSTGAMTRKCTRSTGAMTLSRRKSTAARTLKREWSNGVMALSREGGADTLRRRGVVPTTRQHEGTMKPLQGGIAPLRQGPAG